MPLTPSRGAQRGVSNRWSLAYKTVHEDTPVSAIDFGALTHVCQVGLRVMADGSVVDHSLHTDDLLPAARDAGVYTMLNVTDENYANTDFNGAVTNNQATLIDNIMDEVEDKDYDGVVIDWETNKDFAKLATFLEALRAALGPTRQLSVDLSEFDWQDASLPRIHPHVDRLAIMTYVMGTTGDTVTWFDAAINGFSGVWSMDLARERYLFRGVPAEKLMLGIPFFWERWTGNDGPRQVYHETPVRAEKPYTTILSTYADAYAARVQDATSRTFWAADSATSWINGDTPESIAEKIAWIRSKRTGGWIIWSLDKDYIAAGTTLAEKHPLLAAVKTAMAV